MWILVTGKLSNHKAGNLIFLKPAKIIFRGTKFLNVLFRGVSHYLWRSFAATKNIGINCIL